MMPFLGSQVDPFGAERLVDCRDRRFRGIGKLKRPKWGPERFFFAAQILEVAAFSASAFAAVAAAAPDDSSSLGSGFYGNTDGGGGIAV